MEQSDNLQRRPLRPESKRVGSGLASVIPPSSQLWIFTPHLLRLNICVGVLLLSSTTMGFDSSMMNGLQSLDTWKHYFDSPSGTWLGLMNAVLPLGGLLTSFPAGWMSDAIGRRYTMMTGIIVLCGASAMQGASQNIATFILSRLFVGAGVAMSSVPAPVLISEIAYPTHRGKVTSLYQTCYYVGAIASSWTTFGTFHMKDSTWSWRIPSILQAFFPSIQFIGLFFVPESPRWMIAKGRLDEARAFLTDYHVGGDQSHPLVDYEMQEITHHIQIEREVAGMGWFSLIKTKADKKRLAIAAFTVFISQWSGNGIITYYLSLVLDSVGITSSFTQTLINGILQIFNFCVAILGALLVDRVGRRKLWLFSCAGMLVTYIVFTASSAAFDSSQSHAVGVTVIVFIFLYFFHYDIAVSPLTFAYPTEIFPFHARQKGLAVTHVCQALALMFNSFVNPIALDAIGWRYYIVYIALLVIMSIVVYIFFAETKGHSLEEIADIFEGPAIVAERFRFSTRQPESEIIDDASDTKVATVTRVECVM